MAYQPVSSYFLRKRSGNRALSLYVYIYILCVVVFMSVFYTQMYVVFLSKTNNLHTVIGLNL